jgi:hypothetical protein
MTRRIVKIESSVGFRVEATSHENGSLHFVTATGYV